MSLSSVLRESNSEENNIFLRFSDPECPFFCGVQSYLLFFFSVLGSDSSCLFFFQCCDLGLTECSSSEPRILLHPAQTMSSHFRQPHHQFSTKYQSAAANRTHYLVQHSDVYHHAKNMKVFICDSVLTSSSSKHKTKQANISKNVSTRSTEITP